MELHRKTSRQDSTPYQKCKKFWYVSKYRLKIYNYYKTLNKNLKTSQNFLNFQQGDG